MANKVKNFTFHLSEDQVEWIFKPIRTKLHAITILMRVIKIMLAYQEPVAAQKAGYFSLTINAMSRLVFVSKEKIYSINFPFQITGEIGSFKIYSLHHLDINSKSTSSILALIDDGIFNEPHVLDFAMPVADSHDIDSDLWAFLRELLLWEDGYIRYDDDPGNENGDVHPRYHLDVFYSGPATFKLGLKHPIQHSTFTDILDINTNCRFL